MAEVIKTIGVNYDTKSTYYSENLEAELRDFLDDKGIIESKRNMGLKYKFIDYDAGEMSTSWLRLQADIEEKFPQIEMDLIEGEEEDEDGNYIGDYETLELSL